ncbi:MAG: hypothetical protein AB7S38_40925 [Vulcanimicrobiota bacterium]
MKRRGVSLIEILVIMAVIGVLLVCFAMRPTPTRSLEGSLAADMVAEELRALRREARRSQMPAALVVPRTAEGYATGYYCVRGYDTPRVVRSQAWTADFQHVFMIAGCWGSGPGFLPPAAGQSFDLASWPGITDWVIAFDPSGRVVSNLPNWLGNTCILFSTNAAVATRPVAGQTYPCLQAARHLSTVVVTPEGLVSVLDGAPDGAALATLDSDGGRPPNCMLPSPSGGPAGAAPTLSIQEVFPKRSPSLPPDIIASVQVGRYLRVAVEASDPDGGPLTVRWQAERLSGAADLGQFSNPDPVKMHYQNGAWRAVTEWTPPKDISPVAPEEFVLTCVVEDAEGHQAMERLGSSAGKVWALRDGLVLFDTQRFSGTGQRCIMTVNSDGSDLRQLTPTSVDIGYPRASPNGDAIIMCGWGGGLWAVNRDGSDLRQIVDTHLNGKSDTINACWNPDGSRIAFAVRNFVPLPGDNVVYEDIYIANADGTNIRQIAVDQQVQDSASSPLSWGYVGTTYDRDDLTKQYLLYSQSCALTGIDRVLRFPLDPAVPFGTNSLVTRPSGGSLSNGRLSDDARHFVARASGSLATYDIDPATGNLINEFLSSVSGYNPSFSFDNTRITYNVFTGGGCEVMVMDANGNNPRSVSNSGAFDMGGTWLVGGGLIE